MQYLFRKLIDIGFVILILTLNASCATDNHNLLEKIGKSNRIKIFYSNLESAKSKELIYEITKEKDKQKIIDYFSRNLALKSETSLDWCNIKVSPSVSILGVSFYYQDEFQGYLGIGKDKEDYFLEYYDQKGIKYSCISLEQKKEFIELLKLPKDKLEYIEQVFN